MTMFTKHFNFTVLPNGQTVDVNVVESGTADAAEIYTDDALTQAVSLPDEITEPKTYYVPRQDVNVTFSVNSSVVATHSFFCRGGRGVVLAV